MLTLPTFLISQSESRRAPLMDSLIDSKKFEIILFKGVPGRTVASNPKIIDVKVFEYLNKRKPQSGEVGCAYSHHLIYQQIVDKGLDWSLVLEDDSRLVESQTSYLFSIISEILENQEFSFLPKIIHLKLENRPLIARNFILPSGQRLYKSLILLRESNAYLINYQAAKSAITHGLPLRDVADWPHWISEIDQLALDRDIFSVDRTTPSEIGLRPNEEISEGKPIASSYVSKLKVILKAMSGIEAIEYRRRTKLKDYFKWVMKNRIYRILAAIFGRSDFINNNVIILYPDRKIKNSKRYSTRDTC